MNRKRLILIALLGVLTLCITYAFFAMPRLEKAPPRAGRQPAVAKKTMLAKSNMQRVHLDLLQETAGTYQGAKRDIFRFKVKRVAPPVVAPVKRPKPVFVKPPLPVRAVPIQVTQQALAKFTFLGLLEKGGVRTVFLSSGDDLFVVKPGERFGKDQEFVVTSLEAKTLNIQRRGDSQTIRIPLVENEQLKPIISSPAARTSRGGNFAAPRSTNMPFRLGIRGRSQVADVPPEEVETFEETSPGDVIGEQPQRPGGELQGEARGANQWPSSRGRSLRDLGAGELQGEANGTNQ